MNCLIDKRLRKQDCIEFTNIDFCKPSILDTEHYMQRRTPIIATLNNSNITPVDIQKMMEAGMNVARFKLPNMTKGDKMRMLGKVDRAALNCCKKHSVKDWPVATCVDLKTCVVRTGILEEDVNNLPIKEGSNVILTYNLSDFDSCTEEKIFVDNPSLGSEAKVGMEICIGQEELTLHCTEIVNDKTIKCVVVTGGNLTNMDFVSMRGAIRKRPVLTKKDFHIVRFAIEYQVDMIVINYVREAETLKKIKKYIGKNLKRPLLVSGICDQQDLDNFEEIAKESDAIILARDFLPYELEPAKRYKLCKIQKWLGAKCLQMGKPFIISGGVFKHCLITGDYSDSEVSDVTNALLDGVDGFVLKACNDIENMIEAIKSMDEMCRAIEPYTNSKSGFWHLINEVKVPINAAEAAMTSCAILANQSEAKAIVLPTVTGHTAKALCRLRPAGLVITLSTKQSVTRLLSTFRCAVPLLYTGPSYKNWHQTVEARVHFAIEFAVKKGWLTYGDKYVVLQRASEESSFCDMVRQWPVTISRKPLVECSDEDDNERSIGS